MPFAAPNVLVLGAGGILGEAWMTAVLAGLEQSTGWDPRRCDGYVGTSAGSIVAATLVAGGSPSERVGRMPEPPAADGAGPPEAGVLVQAARVGRAAAAVAGAPLAALGLRSGAPGGALARRIALGRIPRGRHSLRGLGRTLEQAGAVWDGRLRVATVELESGRRVMFGAPGAPATSVGEAVEASCAIPGYFRPIPIAGRTYVDGGAWSPTNLDTAEVSRGTTVLCLNPTGSLRPSRGSPFGAVGPLSRSVAAVEALALGRRGARVVTVAPDRATVAAIAGNLMDPRPRSAVTAAGLAQGSALGEGG